VTLVADSPSPNRNIHSTSSSVQKVDRVSDLPPSYAHLEAEEREKARQQLRGRWNADASPSRSIVPLSLAAPSPRLPLPSNALRGLNAENPDNLDGMSFEQVSREAVEKWKRLKRELGFECQVIDQALLARRVPTPTPSPSHNLTNRRPLPQEIEQRMRTLTPRLAREWADQVKATADAEDDERVHKDDQHRKTQVPVAVPGSPTEKQRSPRWQFYNMYNTVFYPRTEHEDAPRRNWSVTLTSVGVWALVFMTGGLALSPLVSACSHPTHECVYSCRFACGPKVRKWQDFIH
jgi:hypothetical protein